MGTMSEWLPSTHISSTHEPNKENENAKVKREKEERGEKCHRAPFY